MQYKTIGNTKVPAIGQGTQGIHNAEIIKRGIDLGMTFIDTAEVYSNEEVVGQAIKGQRDKVFISTKFSVEHNSYNDILEACENSLKRLGTDYIDLYSMHWYNPAIPLDQIREALIRLQEKGNIKNFGLCNVEMRYLNNFKLSAIQMEYSLFDRSVEVGILPYCEANNVLMIAYSPLLDLYKLPPERMIWLQQIVDDFQLSLSQLVLNWIVSHKSVMTIPKSTRLLHQQLNSVSSDFVLPDEVYGKIDKLFPYEVSYIDPKLIRISSVGKFPQTLKEAEANVTHFTPSPLELAKDLDNIKPVRIEPRDDWFELLEGGLRYWAWVIKYGDKPIPALIKEIKCTEI